MALDSKMYRSPRRPARKREIPLFTSRVESRLTDLLYEPIELARKFLRPKFEKELSFNQGRDIRYVYDEQKNLCFYDIEAAHSNFLFEPIGMFTPTSKISTRSYRFRVELLENEDGKLKSFNFSLEVA